MHASYYTHWTSVRGRLGFRVRVRVSIGVS